MEHGTLPTATTYVTDTLRLIGRNWIFNYEEFQKN